MAFKRILAVSLFLGSILIANASSSTPSSFDWSHGAVVAGAPVTVKVAMAPCRPVTVTLMIGSYTTSKTISELPGGVSLEVPAGTEGQAYSILISCPDDRDSQTGLVL